MFTFTHRTVGFEVFALYVQTNDDMSPASSSQTASHPQQYILTFMPLTLKTLN